MDYQYSISFPALCHGETAPPTLIPRSARIRPTGSKFLCCGYQTKERPPRTPEHHKKGGEKTE